MTQKSEGRISNAKLVLLALVGGIAAFVIALVFISRGGVTQAEIFLPEKTESTVAFRNIDGEVKIVGIEWQRRGQPYHIDEDRQLCSDADRCQRG